MFSTTFHEVDQEFLEREILPFLPDRIFDAHVHILSHDHFAPEQIPTSLSGTPEQLGLKEYYDFIEWIHPEKRTIGGLFFPLPFVQDIQSANEFIASEVGGERGKNAFGQMLTAPDLDPEWIREQVRQGDFVGLKCYHTLAQVEGPTWHAPIEAYLPEEHVRIAHEEGLSITLHVVRERSLADPVNQKTIRHYCETYPDMRLILAHAGRAFNPWHTIEGIHSLKGLANVWFDTSAVTEAGAFEAIIETMGYEHLLYGTDFHVSHIRGRCVAIGDSFHWFYADDMNLDEKHTTLQPVLIGLESLRSLRLACWRMKLSDTQIEAIFCNNATQLYSIH